MRPTHSPTHIARNTEGATIVEFAIVLSVFFVLLMGVIEFGLYMMAQVTVESAVAQGARSAAIGATSGAADPTCPGLSATTNRSDYVQTLIRCRISGLPQANLATISANTVAAGGTVTPDICLNDATPIGSPCGIAPWNGCPPSGSPLVQRFVEVNGTAGYQCGGGTSLGGGGSNSDLIEVRVSYPWKVKFGFLAPLFNSAGVVMITSSIVIKNESF